MNFLNFLTSKTNLFNFGLLPHTHNFQNQNTILVQPENQKSNNQVSLPNKEQSVSKGSLDNYQCEGKVTSQLTPDMSLPLSQEQLIFNQFLELQLKYLSTCLNSPQTPSQIPITPLVEECNLEIASGNKKSKKKNKCGHDDKSHYAKGMCNNCYHKYGRTKKPWNCPHNKLYAAGMCQNCYINNYNRKRREGKQENARHDVDEFEQEDRKKIGKQSDC